MGILDSVKKGAAEAFKTVATDAIKKAAGSTADGSSANKTALEKAAALVGSKVSDAISNTQPASPANSAAAAKAASLVGSKAAPTEQSYAAPNELSPAEVEANIEARVRAKGRPSNWRVSIVDLMSALDMNSSLDARRTLAARLNYSGSAADGSAEKNMWLHEELLKTLAQNGCEVPYYLL